VSDPRWPTLGFDYDTPIPEAIGVALGAASVCWSEIDKAGVFDSSRAKEIGDELLDFLRYKTVGPEFRSLSGKRDPELDL
jgi:hypothetical protein